MSFSGYCAALEEYFRCHDPDAEHDFYLKHDNVIGLSKAEKILSVGAGNGRCEELLKRAGLLNNLTEYHGLEPHNMVRQQLDTKMRKLFPDAKLVLTQDTADDYEGPKDTFDIIFMVQMINYAKDRIGLIKRSLEWLKPGGRLIIEQMEGGSSIYSFGSRVADSKRTYEASELLSDLKELNVTYQKLYLEVEYNVQNPTQELVNFYVLREADAKETAEVKTFLKQSVPTGKEMHTFAVCVIEKPS